MNLEVPETINTGVLDSNTMTVLESLAPSDEHHPEPMVIYVQSNQQVDGQMLSLNEDPLSFPEVGALEGLGNPGEQIVTLVDDLGQALGEGQAVPITLSDIANIDFVDGTGAAFQTEDGQVLYLTYTVDHGSGEAQLNDAVTLQANGGVDVLTGLNIPASQQQQQIVLDMSTGDGNYMMTGEVNNASSLLPDNSMPLISIPECKKSTTGRKENVKLNKRNTVDHRKTARVIGPEVHIEDKLQVLEAMVPRVERPKKKKLDPKSVKQKLELEQKDEQSEKKENEGEPAAEERPKKEEKAEGEKDGLYMCDLCGNAYARAAQYYGHLHTHRGERDWNCHLCGEVFKSHSQLRRHESRSHLNMRPYPCSVCGNRFDRASQLRYHERRIHAGEKPHRCLICSKGFFKRSDLRTHVNIHLGINKSICETCGKQFNHVSNLIRHTRVHTGIKPYPCNVCGRRFSQVNALQHHKDSHNTTREFSCTSCHKQFKSSFLLRKHMRSMHADSVSLNQKEEKYVGQNRRYYCNVCGENFAFSVMLKDHESKHQKETNFHCNCCGNNYKSADEFKVHSCNETEDSKIKEEEAPLKKEVAKNYSELLKRIAKVVTDKVDDVSDYQEGVNETVLGDDMQEPETSLTKTQALILGMGKSPHNQVETVGDSKSAVNKEQNEFTRTSKVSEVCGGFKILQPGDMDTNWIVGSSIVSGEAHSEEKWIPIPQQEESEIVIYVTPDLHHDVEVKKVTLPASTAIFKKEDTEVNSELQGDAGKFAVAATVLRDEGCINVQVQNGTDSSVQEGVESSQNRGEGAEAMEDQFGDIPAVDEKKMAEMALRDPFLIVKEKAKPPGKTFKCKECGKVFYKNSNYKQHLGIHFVDLQRYQCKLCGRSFAWKSTLNKHMTNSHQTGPAPKFSCGYCPKEYATSSQVQEHIKRDHYKERPHTCTVCEKTFYKKYDLKIHLRTHTKEKPYICGACGKAFYHLSHIIRHERIHTGERPYKCDDCGREFNQSSSLKTHKIRHSNCSASANKLEASSKAFIAGEHLTMLSPLPESLGKNKASKKAHSVEPEINIDILSAKDANLSFESIPSSYEENGISS